jgi:hypothetical protein
MEIVQQPSGLRLATSLNAKLSLIRAATAGYFEVAIGDIQRRTGNRELTRIRQIGMYLAKELTVASYPDVGAFFGAKDHTTIMAACRRVAELQIQGDPSTQRALQEIRQRLEGGLASSTETDIRERLARIEQLLERPVREKLPVDREGVTLHFVIHALEDDKVVEVDGYLQTGEHPDGRLGELFLKVGKQGDHQALLDDWAISTSIALQHGAPLEDLLGKFVNKRYEPSGAVTGVEGIKRCTSPLDLVCRWLLFKYSEKGS